jgi:AraC-like DNA-binding protein
MSMLVSPPLQVLMNRLQILAGRLSDLSPAALIDELPLLVSDLPAVMSQPEQLLATSVLCQTLLRIAQRCGLDEHTRVVGAIVRLNEPRRGADWRTSWTRAAESCARVFARTGWADRSWSLSTQRTAIMLDLLDAQFTNPTFSLKDLATAIDLSPSQTVRLLKQATGLGLAAHLQLRRITRAKQLLTLSALSVKEIASASGYSTTSHFCRRFKTSSGVTPIGYRLTRRPAVTPVTPARRI